MMMFSLAQQIEEVDYELAYRAQVYARIIAKSPSRSSELEYHVARMQAVRATLVDLRSKDIFAGRDTDPDC